MRFGGRGIVAAAVLMAAAGAAPGYAADLGGNCCADLEERIAELEATTARKGNRKVSLTIYGEINQALMYWDDGIEDNVYVVTNATTKNIFGFEGRATISPELSAGYRLEIEARNAPSDFVDQGAEVGGFGDEGGASGLVIRHSNWWIEHKWLGRVTLGRGSNATDGIAEIDLSGSSALGVSAVESWNEGFILRDSRTGTRFTIPGGTDIGLFVDIFAGNFDGGRGELVLYETPVFGGFKASASWGEDDDWDVALRYATEVAGFQIAAGIGYHDGVITDTENLETIAVNFASRKEWTGSASVLHTPTGLFLTAAGGARDWDPVGVSGEKYGYAKAGIFQRFNSLGKTSIFGEYYHVWDVGLESGTIAICDNGRCEEEASAVGFGVVQHIDAAAMEVYLGYRHYWADDLTDPNTGVDHELKFDAVMSGARIKF